jgi:hypothetical protein
VPNAESSPLSCWLELAPVDIEIEPRLVEVYFTEIRTSAANRQPGLHCRHGPCLGASAIASSPGSSWGRDAGWRGSRPGLDLEIVVLGSKPIAVGEPLEFQVLRDGRPFAGFPVELVSERSALGIWRESDADGKLRHSLPFAGRWLAARHRLAPVERSARTPGKAASSRWRSRRAEIRPSFKLRRETGAASARTVLNSKLFFAPWTLTFPTGI